MCGIVAGVAQDDVIPLLLRGLARLEYRGYDSAGVAVLMEGALLRRRVQGKVAVLQALMDQDPMEASLGIAHTRWATHGAPSERNAHPHVSRERIALVHNGIIENYHELHERYQKRGYTFSSETDSEIVAHAVDWHMQQHANMMQAIEALTQELKGAYAIALFDQKNPEYLWAFCHGAPLVVAKTAKGSVVASDVLAIADVASEFRMMHDGDLAVLSCDEAVLFHKGQPVVREIRNMHFKTERMDKGHYDHHMQKEMAEQVDALSECLEGRLGDEQIPEGILGAQASEILKKTTNVILIACGTSYHAALIARLWLEQLGVRARADVASELRYHPPVLDEGSLIVSISQSGETADTLAALKSLADHAGAGMVCVCNSPESSMVRMTSLTLLTHAGPEIGVASTKAFTTQLACLYLLALLLGRQRLDRLACAERMASLRALPAVIAQVLNLEPAVQRWAKKMAQAHNALFLGRGLAYPVALEGALKLKEISYIHAAAYPAGELKHGPLALVDANMPVVALVPNNNSVHKMRANLQEVQARGGRLFVLAEEGLDWSAWEVDVIEVPCLHEDLSPITMTIPLQLLAYHVALLRGTNVDQPRNLAKSVTVE